MVKEINTGPDLNFVQIFVRIYTVLLFYVIIFKWRKKPSVIKQHKKSIWTVLATFKVQSLLQQCASYEPVLFSRVILTQCLVPKEFNELFLPERIFARVVCSTRGGRRLVESKATDFHCEYDSIFWIYSIV